MFENQKSRNKTRQVQEILVSTLEHLQVPKKIAPRDQIFTRYFFSRKRKIDESPRKRDVAVQGTSRSQEPGASWKITFSSTRHFSSGDEIYQPYYWPYLKKVRRACPFPECNSGDRKIKRNVFQSHFSRFI